MGVVVLLAFIIFLTFVSLCIIVPPWTPPLLIAATIATEWSPYFLAANLLTLIVAVAILRDRRRWLAASLLVVSLALSSLPIVLLVRDSNALAARKTWLVPHAQAIVNQQDIPIVLGGKATFIRAYIPAGESPTPIVFAIYGGQWRHGSAAKDARLNQTLAELGFAVFALDYRHSPQYHFPVALHDIQDEIRFITRRAAMYHADPTHIAIIGHSSGGELALLTAFAGTIPVKAVISYSGPIDLADSYMRPPRPDPLEIRAILRDFIGGTPFSAPQAYHAASPIGQVGPVLPRVLLIYGARDHVVDIREAIALRALLTLRGEKPLTLFLPWAEHGFELVPFGLHARLAYAAVAKFLIEALHPKVATGRGG